MKNLISPRQSNGLNEQPSNYGLAPRSEASLIGLRETGSFKFVAEWQDRGPETLSGHTLQKLRLTFVPADSVIAASAAA
jgi:hypothetical protein